MSNVFTLPTASRPRRIAHRPEPAPASAEQVEAAAEMVQQSAVMQLVSTLAFYARGGFDHGAKAQAVMPAVREILAGRGIDLVVQF